MSLVAPEGAGGLREERLQVFKCLQQRIGSSTDGWRALAAQKTSYRIEPAAQPTDDSVGRLQRERQTQGFCGGLDRSAAKQFDQQRP